MSEQIETKIFLSYNSKERKSVKKFSDILSKAGIVVFFDANSIEMGSTWQEVLEEGLIKSNYCLIFLGKHGLGRWQNEEIRVAIDKRIADRAGFRVIPVLLPGCTSEQRAKLPLLLAQIQGIDLNEISFEEGCQKILAGIRPQHGSTPMGTEPPTQNWHRFLTSFLTIAAISLIAAIAYAQYFTTQDNHGQVSSKPEPHLSSDMDSPEEAIVDRKDLDGRSDGNEVNEMEKLKPSPEKKQQGAIRLSRVTNDGYSDSTHQTDVVNARKLIVKGAFQGKGSPVLVEPASSSAPAALVGFRSDQEGKIEVCAWDGKLAEFVKPINGSPLLIEGVRYEIICLVDYDLKLYSVGVNGRLYHENLEFYDRSVEKLAGFESWEQSENTSGSRISFLETDGDYDGDGISDIEELRKGSDLLTKEIFY